MIQLKQTLVIAITSIPLISIGALLRETSPEFDRWFMAMTSEMKLVEGGALGAELSTWWIFIMVSWICGITLFIGIYAIGMRLIKNVKHTQLSKMVLKAIMVIVFIYPMISITRDMIENIRWGFIILALGELVTILALLMGIYSIGMIKSEDKPYKAKL